MQIKEIKILIYCLLMCVASGSTFYWLSVRQQKKICVVDAVKLFDSFNMKKELESMAKDKLESESKQLDSISNAANMAKATNNEEEIKKLTYDFSYMKAKLEDDYTKSNHDINEQVWKRLNPMLDEYGKKKGLHLIIGANGMGSVLYTDEYFDCTNEVIEYINKKYAEGN